MLRLSAACVLLVLVGVSLAEPPASGGYPDRRNGGGGGGSGGGGYQQVNSGQQTSEGQTVDPQLLDMVKMLLLQHESESGNGGGGGAGGPYPSSNGGGSGGPYGSYGPPAGSNSQGRVTGIELENPRQSMQVAEYWQGGDEQSAPRGQYGAPGQGAPSGSYGAPSDSYGAPLGRK